MQKYAFPVMVAIACLAVLPPAAAQPLKPAAVVLRLAQQNPGLRSYTARVLFDVDLRAFLTIHPTLNATYYFKRPDKAELDFDTIPVFAEQFEHLYAALASPDRWPAIYDIRFTRRPVANGPYELTLTPKKMGNVDRVLVTVDSASFGVTRMEWRYKNGSWIVMQQTNAKVGDYLLPQGQVGDFNLPSYKAHVVATYSTYRLNVPIPDSVFKH